MKKRIIRPRKGITSDIRLSRDTPVIIHLTPQPVHLTGRELILARLNRVIHVIMDGVGPTTCASITANGAARCSTSLRRGIINPISAKAAILEWME
jgi:hypothetical protein